MIPTTKSNAGFGCLRRTRGNGRTVVLIQNKNGWVHKTYKDMADSKGINGDYWVFAFPERFESTDVESKIGTTYKLGKPAAVTAFGFNDFTDAQDKYLQEIALTGKTRDAWVADDKRFLTDDGGNYD